MKVVNGVSKEEVMRRVQGMLDQSGLKINVFEEDVSVVLGGSYASGTSTGHSDIDVRVVVPLTLDNELSIKPFTHAKMAEGENKINGEGDMDIEVFSSTRFLRGLYHGEVVPHEILNAGIENIWRDTEWMKEIRENREELTGKNVTFNMWGLAKTEFYRAKSPVHKVRNEIRKNRINDFGYDVKAAAKFMMYTSMIKEVWVKGYFDLRRPDAEKIKSWKEGNVHKDHYEILSTKVYREIEDHLDGWDKDKYPNEDKVNELIRRIVKGR